MGAKDRPTPGLQQDSVAPVEQLPVESDEQAVLGNACFQQLCSEDGGPADEVKDPWLAAFLGESFSADNNVPSTGFGCFDARYSPCSGTLDITLKLGFDFKLAEDASWGDWWNDVGAWTEAEKAQWIDEFVSVVEATWQTSRTIECTKPGWCLQVTPVVHVVPVEWGDGHYDVTVRREPLNAREGSRPSVSEGSPFFAGGSAKMTEDSTEVGLDDSGVVDTERQRVRDYNDERIQFDIEGEAARPTAQGKARLSAIKSDLGSRAPGTPKLSVDLDGWGDNGHQEACWDATSQVTEQLASGPHSFRPSYWGENPVGEVGFAVNDHQDSVDYESEFSFAAHEVGHMFGLTDEYEDATVDPERGARQDALIESAGVQRLERDVDTTSVMSNGGDILPGHLVTFWEVLGRMTASYLDPSEWKL